MALAGLLGAVTVVEAVRAVRGTGRASLAISMAGLTVGRVLDTDELSARFGEAAWLITSRHAASLVVAIGMVAFARSITGTRWRMSSPWVWAVLGVGLVVPLVDPGALLPVDDDARIAVFAGSPVWLVHWGAYLSVSLLAAVAVTTTSLRSIGASRGAFRAQLACLATGTTLVMVYALLNAVHLTTLALRPGTGLGPLAGVEQVVSNLASLMVGLSLLTGLLEPVAVGVARRRRVWALWPVWVGLWDFAPHLDAERPGRLRSALARDPHMVLVRLVVEIGDAARVLTPHLPEHDASRPVERAAALQVAAERHRRGDPVNGSAPPPDLERTLDQRAQELHDVARVWTGPRTAEARTRLAHRLSPTP